jgi:hypothetical protein
LFARAALVVERDDPLGGAAHVGDDESDARNKLARVKAVGMRLTIATNLPDVTARLCRSAPLSALQHILDRARVHPKMGQVELHPSASELRATGQRDDGATNKDVPLLTAKILVVGFSCIVVSVKMAQVFQLLEAAALIITLNIVFEPFPDAAFSPAGATLGAV